MAEDWADWIRRQKQEGRTRQEVREYLTEQGYDASIVDEHWSSTALREMEQPTVLDDLSWGTVLENWRTVMTTPGGFFRRTELGPRPAIVFAVLCLGVYTALSTVATGAISMVVGGGLLPGVLAAATWAGYFIGGVVISGLLYFVMLRLLGGGASVTATMTVMLYSTAPLLLAWLPVVGRLVMLFSIYIQIAGLTEINDVTRGRVLLAFILQVLLAIGVVGWQLAALIA